MNYLLSTAFETGKLLAYRERHQPHHHWVPTEVHDSPREILAITAHGDLPVVYVVHRRGKTEMHLTVFALTGEHHFRPIQSFLLENSEAQRYALCVVPSRRRLFIATDQVRVFSLDASGHVRDTAHPLVWELARPLGPFLRWAVSPNSSYAALAYSGSWTDAQEGGLAVFYIPHTGKPQNVPVHLTPIVPNPSSELANLQHTGLTSGTHSCVFLDNHTLLVTTHNYGLVTFACRPDLVNHPNPVYNPQRPSYYGAHEAIQFDTFILLPNHYLVGGEFDRYIMYRLDGLA